MTWEAIVTSSRWPRGLNGPPLKDIQGCIDAIQWERSQAGSSEKLTLAAKAIGDLLCAAVFLTGRTRAEGCGLGVHRAATCKINGQCLRDADITFGPFSELLHDLHLR